MIYVVGCTYENVWHYVKEEGLKPGQYCTILSARSIRGCRIGWQDELVILDSALERKDWPELRAALWPATT